MNQITADVVTLSPQEILDRWGDALQIPIVVIRETAPASPRQPSQRGALHHQRGLRDLERLAGTNAADILTIVEGEGWRMTGSGLIRYGLSATQTIVMIYQTLGAGVLARTLRLLREVYDGDPGCAKQFVLRGVAEGLARIPDGSHVDVIKRMREVYPDVASLHADGGNFYAVIKDRVIQLARQQ